MKKIVTYIFISLLTLSFSVESALHMMNMVEQNAANCNHDMDCDTEDSECDDTPEKKIKLFVANETKCHAFVSGYYINSDAFHYYVRQKINIKGYTKSIDFPPDLV